MVIRATEIERRHWERLAEERGLSVSDLVRYAVDAYCSGQVGIAFSAACAYRSRHTSGRICPGCGGSARVPI